jgi:hydroxyacylglutathione hydrolase
MGADPAFPILKEMGCPAELDSNGLLVVHCKGGYRSSSATSILRRANFRDIANLTGGFDAWKAMEPSACLTPSS